MGLIISHILLSNKGNIIFSFHHMKRTIEKEYVIFLPAVSRLGVHTCCFCTEKQWSSRNPQRLRAHMSAPSSARIHTHMHTYT